jgi:hypothetical protein
MREAPGPGEPFAGAVYFRRRALALRGEPAVLEIIPEGAGRVTLSDPAGHQLFSHPPSELRVTLAPGNSFRVQHGDERWWLWGASIRSDKEFERVRQTIDRDDVMIAVPKLPDADERAYKRLMRNRTAQQRAWCRLWIAALRAAGAT